MMVMTFRYLVYDGTATGIVLPAIWFFIFTVMADGEIQFFEFMYFKIQFV